MKLTRAMADDLATRQKYIGELVKWKRCGQSVDRHRFDVLVACEDLDEPLRLTGYKGRKNWSYVLLTRGGIPLRKLTVHSGGHRNPDGSPAGSRHKHIWDPIDEDRWTYYPEDINFDDFNEGLIGFLKECNIECAALPEPLLVQRRLK